MNKEQPIKGKEEILNEISKEDTVPHWVTKKHALLAMEEYKNQFIAEWEERLFTLKEALEVWEASGEWEYRRNFGAVPTRALNKDEYFKEKFGIDL